MCSGWVNIICTYKLLSYKRCKEWFWMLKSSGDLPVLYELQKYLLPGWARFWTVSADWWLFTQMLWVLFYKFCQSSLINNYMYLLLSVGSFFRLFRLTCIVNLKVNMFCCERLFEGNKAVEVLVVYPMILGWMNDQGWSFKKNPQRSLSPASYSMLFLIRHLSQFLWQFKNYWEGPCSDLQHSWVHPIKNHGSWYVWFA